MQINLVTKNEEGNNHPFLLVNIYIVILNFFSLF